MSTSGQRIRLRRDTSANWSAANPVLLSGEPGYATDTGSFKIGDGITPWNNLPYANGSRLQDLTDVLASSKVDGSVLYYSSNSQKFLADALETKLTLTDGGNF